MAYDQLKLDNQICFRLYTATRLVTQSYSPFFKEMGITYPQYLVLMDLWEQDNQFVGDIARRLGLETNTVTPLLQRMQKMGIVTRSKGKADARQTVVSLTAEGKKLESYAKDIPSCLASNLQENGVTSDDLMALAPLLDKLILSLQK